MLWRATVCHGLEKDLPVGRTRASGRPPHRTTMDTAIASLTTSPARTTKIIGARVPGKKGLSAHGSGRKKTATYLVNYLDKHTRVRECWRSENHPASVGEYATKRLAALARLIALGTSHCTIPVVGAQERGSKSSRSPNSPPTVESHHGRTLSVTLERRIIGRKAVEL